MKKIIAKILIFVILIKQISFAGFAPILLETTIMDNNGNAITGSKKVIINLYSTTSDGQKTKILDKTINNVVFTEGNCSIKLEDINPNNLSECSMFGIIIYDGNTPGSEIEVPISAVPIAKMAENVKNISINDNGNVGIGITNPIKKLEVKGIIQATGQTDAYFMGIHEGNYVLANTEYPIIRTNNGVGIWGRKGVSNNYGTMIFKTHKLQADGPVERMRLLTDGSGTRLGLGTSAPTRKFDINDPAGNCLRLIYNDEDGSATYYSDFLVSSTGNLIINPIGGSMQLGTASNSYRQFILGGGNSYGYIYGAWNTLGDGINIGYNYYNNNKTDYIYNSLGSTSRMKIGYGYVAIYTGIQNTVPNNLGYYQNNLGNVGIGTTTPSEKLEVAGTVKATNLDVKETVTANVLQSGSILIDKGSPTITLRSYATDFYGKILGQINFQGVKTNAKNGINITAYALDSSTNGMSSELWFNITKKSATESTLTHRLLTGYSHSWLTNANKSSGLITSLDNSQESIIAIGNNIYQAEASTWRSSRNDGITLYQQKNDTHEFYCYSTQNIDTNITATLASNKIVTIKPSGLDVAGTVKATKFVKNDGTEIGTGEISKWRNISGGINYNDGNVGIGTTTPSEKLEVAGTLKATKFVGDGSGLSNLPFTSSQWGAGKDTGIMYEGQKIEIGVGGQGPQRTAVIQARQSYGTNDGGNSINGNHLELRAGIGTGSGNSGDIRLVTEASEPNWGNGARHGSGAIRMIIKDNGNVGIGTTTPTEKLDVTGTVKATKFVGDGSGLTGVGSQWNNVQGGINYNSGNVGIGTATPSEKLDVAGTVKATKCVINGVDNYTNGIVLQNTSAYQHLITGYQDGNNITTGSALQFRVSNNSSGGNAAVMTLKGNGNVGIGTTTPTEKLCVNGKIKAKEVNITLDGWSDFVFAPNYNLMPLNKVEEHIKANNHLPGIPSEKEVLENGVSIGDMQSKLLQKIEELTLYVIELKKENEILKNKVEVLNEKVNA